MAPITDMNLRYSRQMLFKLRPKAYRLIYVFATPGQSSGARVEAGAVSAGYWAITGSQLLSLNQQNIPGLLSAEQQRQTNAHHATAHDHNIVVGVCAGISCSYHLIGH